ncbi:head-tail adaptor protein [Sinisalibacter aestuarii]|uniref:Tail protein n=1 Tax=Sinisalibacter aestuarii TaxID=2949426 RepID=A0ABQ5LUU1_9RHOB|nr:head-tail adaptor protein [Sinisalibacter aestuarii]GKY88729.1 tail protein [Sinisalibacter aestuarii]
MKGPVLNRKLVLEAPVRLPDGAGGFATTWEVLGTLWAEIRPGAGRERAVELMTVATLPLRITVRAAPEGAPSRPVPEQRFRAGQRVFRILAVTEADAGAQYLSCFAQEEVSQ